MELSELKHLAKSCTNQIENDLAAILKDNNHLENWHKLRKSVTVNVQQPDATVLKEMIGYFGEGCLKELIREASGEIIRKYEKRVVEKSAELKISINKIGS